MQDLIEAYWMWFGVALLVGGAVGYWLPGQPGTRRLFSWGAAVVLAGLAATTSHLFPPGGELDLETLLLLSFWFALGGLLGCWLRVAVWRAETARAIRASHARVEGAMLGARAKATVRADHDAVGSTTAIEDARLDVEAKANEMMRVAAAAKAAEEAADEERLTAEAKAAEEARIAAATKALQDERLADQAKAADQARLAAAEDARLAAEAKIAEETRAAAALKAVQDERLAAAKLAEAARLAATAEPAEDKPTQQSDVAGPVPQPYALHPGSKPQGIAPPAGGEADNLKLIKGIGPKTEKTCNALGIYQLRQIADWNPGEAVWIGRHIGHPGKIEREHWIAQARLLGSGGETEHSRAVKSEAIVVDDKADEPLDPAAAEMLGKSLPEQAAAVDGEAKHPGRRPYGLAAARGKADNLKRIRGIGPQNEGRLHGLGIWHFAQIAAWSDDNVKWVGSYLAFSGRIHRENWVAQARDLAAGKEPEPRRAAASKVKTSKDDGSPGEGNVRTSK